MPAFVHHESAVPALMRQNPHFGDPSYTDCRPLNNLNWNNNFLRSMKGTPSIPSRARPAVSTSSVTHNVYQTRFWTNTKAHIVEKIRSNKKEKEEFREQVKRQTSRDKSNDIFLDNTDLLQKYDELREILSWTTMLISKTFSCITDCSAGSIWSGGIGVITRRKQTGNGTPTIRWLDNCHSRFCE